jgi:hypothetical protein
MMVDTHPPVTLKITVQDLEPSGTGPRAASGIQTIQVTQATNLSRVSIPDPPPGKVDGILVCPMDGPPPIGCFVTGFVEGAVQVEVDAVKDKPSKPSRIGLEITDVAGNVMECDPVITTIERSAAQNRTRQRFGALSQHDSYVTIQNGAPGLKRLRIKVNGKKSAVLGLEDAGAITVDVSRFMVEGENTITLIGYGKPGTSALIIISDGALAHGLKLSPGE